MAGLMAGLVALVATLCRAGDASRSWRAAWTALARTLRFGTRCEVLKALGPTISALNWRASETRLTVARRAYPRARARVRPLSPSSHVDSKWPT